MRPYCVVDYHAITVLRPETLRSPKIAYTAAFMLGAGLILRR